MKNLTVSNIGISRGRAACVAVDGTAVAGLGWYVDVAAGIDTGYIFQWEWGVDALWKVGDVDVVAIEEIFNDSDNAGYKSYHLQNNLNQLLEWGVYMIKG